jgi:hypothetical protein
VATAQAAPSCGPAQAQWRSDGELRLQLADLRYLIQLRGQAASVVLMHGSMQVDEFSAPFEWAGPTLQLRDTTRQVLYEVRFRAR